MRLLKEGIKLEGVGEVEIEWDFDCEAYNDWLKEEGLEGNQDNLLTYINDAVTFSIEYFDNDTYHHMGYDYVDFTDLIDTFGNSLSKEIIESIVKEGSFRFETSELYNRESFDVNEPNELNQIAMKILNHGEYYKGCRGFILTNGVIVYTPAEHNMVSQINGIEGTFDFIKKGNIRILDQSINLSKPPTREQKDVLKQVVSSYSDEVLYVDILGSDGNYSATYKHPNWRYVLGEIDRYFSEGLQPQGKITESFESNFTDYKFFGYPDKMLLLHNGKDVCVYNYYDSKAYPFLIWRGELYVGEKRQTHGQLEASIHGFFLDSEPYIEGRIWVGVKVNEFNYAVVCFWGNKCSENIKPYVYELARKLKVNAGKIVVISKVGDKLKNMSLPILLSDWDGYVHSLTNTEKEQKNLHIMSAKEKSDNTSDFRKVRDEKIGKKLSNDSNKEMPMAQYHSLIYQEGKENKNIVISENQYNRLFTKK